MSGCDCDHSDGYNVRISDELLWNNDTEARFRCRDCGGKAGFISVDALTAFGISPEDVKQSADAGPVQICIEFDAQWKNLAGDL